MLFQPPWCLSTTLKAHSMKQRRPSPSSWSLLSPVEHRSGTFFSAVCVSLFFFILFHIFQFQIVYLLVAFLFFLHPSSYFYSHSSSVAPGAPWGAIKVTHTYKSNLLAGEPRKWDSHPPVYFVFFSPSFKLLTLVGSRLQVT